MTRFQVNVRSLMIVVATCGLLCWPIGVAAKRAFDAQSEAQCSANLTEIGAAIAQYEAKYGHFPPAYVTDASGKPAHSWRVLLLEFLDPALFRQYSFTEPWNGPNNSKLASKMPRVYACPSHDGPMGLKTSSYAVIVGAESAFPESGSVKLTDITDRTYNIPTILIAEAASLNTPWMAPRDLRSDQIKSDWSDISRSGISSQHQNGAGLLCLGGQIRRARLTMRMYYLKEMITISGNEYFCDTSY
jgi:hypothetical protein